MKNTNGSPSTEENKEIEEERKVTDDTSLVNKGTEAETDYNPDVKRLIFHPDFLPMIVFASISAVSWFTPLAGSRVVENSFALNYRGVNIASLYIA
jgi:hypothetical protein